MTIERRCERTWQRQGCRAAINHRWWTTVASCVACGRGCGCGCDHRRIGWTHARALVLSLVLALDRRHAPPAWYLHDHDHGPDLGGGVLLLLLLLLLVLLHWYHARHLSRALPRALLLHNHCALHAPPPPPHAHALHHRVSPPHALLRDPPRPYVSHDSLYHAPLSRAPPRSRTPPS